jgi:hypothetical protein
MNCGCAVLQMSLDRRISRLEQFQPQLTGSAEIVIESYFLDPAYPELGRFERHYQHGAIVYDGFVELLALVNGKTRSL